MSVNPRRVFFLLIILASILIVVDLPEQYHLQATVGPVRFSRIINPPVIDIRLLGLRVQKTIRTHLGLDLSGGTSVTLAIDMKDIAPQDKQSAVEAAKQIIERRVNFFGVSEPIVQTARVGDLYRIIVELPGITNVDEAVATIGKTARLDFRELTDPKILEATESAIVTLANTKTVGISGSDLTRASVSFSSQTGEAEVALEFSAAGAKKFADVTRRLTGKPLAIFLDDFSVSAPVVSGEIPDGRAVITGNFNSDTAKTLAVQLNAGALPVPVSVIEKHVVGATLGQESVTRSIRAGAIGLAIVALFMIAKYGRLGMLADMALILYGLISFAFVRLIPITLTLPGIAGFILSVGMAVDSNILIFERYKEELRKGKPWQIAMELGFSKAWDSIRDANFTTLITCVILFNPGNWNQLPSSGLVRGFALTLFFGVVTSLFTGIVVTRTLIRVLYKEKL